MTWATLKAVIVDMVRRRLGLVVADLIDRLLPGGNEPVKAMAAPADLKKLIHDTIFAVLDQWDKPILALPVKAVVNELDGAIIDHIWDSLFAKALVPAGVHSFPPTVRGIQTHTPQDKMAEVALAILDEATPTSSAA